MINLVEVWLKPVVAKFIPYDEEKKQAGCNSYGQPDNIYGRISLVSYNIPESNFEIIENHCVFVSSRLMY
jgi:hypothetical protein